MSSPQPIKAIITDFVPDITGKITEERLSTEVFDIQFNCLVNQLDMVWNMIELLPTEPSLQLIILVLRSI